MKVSFVQSGGFVGTVKGCDLDTAALNPSEHQELERLVRGSGIARSGQFLSQTGRDLQQYDLVIEDGDRAVTVTFDDASVPRTAKPLLGYLKKHARPQAL